ncbi:MAG: hypothetical protein NZ890_21245 [Myxococcota bacterium]|nr:hypothetical protein [Myxococcota bacterium]
MLRANHTGYNVAIQPDPVNQLSLSRQQGRLPPSAFGGALDPEASAGYRIPMNGPEPRDAPMDPGEERRIRERLEKLIPDILRRALDLGTTALFTTEEGIRRLVTEFQLPRDVAAYLLSQVTASKDEVVRIIAQEVRRFLETVNLSGELQKLLTSLSFEIRTEIRFIPNDEAVGGVRPDMKGKVAVKRNREEDR